MPEPKFKLARSWLVYLATVVLFATDRALKSLVLARDYGASAGWHGWAEFTLFRNDGVAFSLPVPDAVFWPLAGLALAALGVWYWIQRGAGRQLTAALICLVILGGLSNLLDRAAYGQVIDYLMFFGRSAVNLADGMIVGGLIGLVVTSRPKSKYVR